MLLAACRGGRCKCCWQWGCWVCGAWELAGNWFSCDPSAENWSLHPSEAAGRSPFAAFPYCHPSGETRRGLLRLLYSSWEGRIWGRQAGKQSWKPVTPSDPACCASRGRSPRISDARQLCQQARAAGVLFPGLIYAQAAPLRELLRHGFLTGT